MIIACEADGADWLPFDPMRSSRAFAKKTSAEVIWLQDDCDFCDMPFRLAQADWPDRMCDSCAERQWGYEEKATKGGAGDGK